MAGNGSINGNNSSSLPSSDAGLGIPTDERIINIVVLVPILLIGVIGNICVALVIITGKNNHQRTKSNVYVLSLAIADLIFLLSGPGLNLLRYLYGRTDWFLPAIFCKLFVFSSYASANSGATIIACFSIERFFAVYYPLKLFRTITMLKQLVIVGIATLLPTGYSILWFVQIGVNARGICTYSLGRDEYLVFYLVDLIAFFVVPVLVMIFANGFIVYRIVAIGFDEDIISARLSSRDSTLKSFNNSSLHLPGAVTGTNYTSCSNNSAPLMQRHTVGRNGSTLSKRPSLIAGPAGDSKLATKMLIAVSLIFIITCLPYRAFVVYNSFFYSRGNTPWRVWLSNASRWLWYFNSAVNPVVYNILSNRFRRSFIKLCVASARFLPRGLKQTSSSRFGSTVALSQPEEMIIPQAHINMLYIKPIPQPTAQLVITATTTTTPGAVSPTLSNKDEGIEFNV